MVSSYNFVKQCAYLITRHNNCPTLLNNLLGACARLCQTTSGTVARCGGWLERRRGETVSASAAWTDVLTVCCLLLVGGLQ